VKESAKIGRKYMHDLLFCQENDRNYRLGRPQIASRRKAEFSTGVASRRLCFQLPLNRVATKLPKRIGRNPSRRWRLEGMYPGRGLDGK
jgi:hypothetical protein